MNKNILVTGGLGFIGSHYVKILTKEKYYPVILDKVTYAADLNRIKGDIYEDEIFINNRLYVGDICDKKLVEYIIKEHNINTIINFAAETHVDNSIKDSKQFIHSNIIGTHVLLETIQENNLRFIQISTDEVYGSITNKSFKETDKLNPGNPYSASKACADLLTLSYYNTYNSNVVITRSSNNYGPYQHTEKFIPHMINLAMNKKDLEIYGDGNNIRDWIHVEDKCRAILKVMEEGKSGNIYNIAAKEEKSNNTIATFIAERSGVNIKYISDRPGHDYRYSINCDKIKNELNWDTKISFNDGLINTIKFYIEQNKDLQ